MTAGWTAGQVRARAMARREVGPAGVRKLAACSSLAEARRMLAATSYGPAGADGLSLAAAQRAVSGIVLWDLRVLAGWLPRDGVALLRTLAGWFELANVDELLQSQAGRPADPEFELGALATAWPRLRDARSMPGLRAALAATPWHDPGGDAAGDIRLGLRARWAVRVAELGDPARTWAAGAAALLLAGQRLGGGAPGAAGAAGTAPASRPALAALGGLLGPAAATAAAATTLSGLRESLPARARWVLAPVSSPSDLWPGQAAWWDRVARDGHALLRAAGGGREPVLGTAAVLAADAWRIRAALELAARGGGDPEAIDAVA